MGTEFWVVCSIPLVIFSFIVYINVLKPVVAMLLRRWKYQRNIRNLQETGRTLRAKILTLEPGERTHRSSRILSIKHERNAIRDSGPFLTERPLRLDESSLSWIVTLSVEMSYLTKIEVKKEFYLSRMQYMQMVPGKTIDVILNPSDPQSLEILWDQK